jgi:hypothetical protein
LGQTFPESSSNSTAPAPIGSFDVMVFRIPQGWIHPSDVTKEAMQETVDLAHELFNVTTLIFTNLPFINNIDNYPDLIALQAANDGVRTFVDRWEPSTGVQRVLMLDFRRLTDSLMEWNAQRMGLDTSTMNYTLVQLAKESHFRRSIAQHCSILVTPNISTTCPRSFFSADGMHWCMKVLGGRIFGGLACLMACATSLDARRCEAECNDKYMSLQPLDETDFAD